MAVYLDCETTGLDADVGMLVAVGILTEEGEKTLFVESPENEASVLKELFQLLEKHKGDEIYIWNAKFDVPFLLTRAVKHGVDASVLFQLKIVDLCKFSREMLKLSSNKLDEVSKFLELNKNLKVTGKNVQKLYLDFLQGKKANKEEIVNHCLDDIRRLKEIHEKMKKYVEFWKKKTNHLW